MLQRIRVNLEEIESMLYFWQASRDKEKVSEIFIGEFAQMPGISISYDEEFNAESVRKVLSAITNRELLSQKTKKEARFWNNNMWMMEDLSYTDMMVKPLKKLNLDSLLERLRNTEGSEKYDEIEVRFAPLHVEDYYIDKNRLVINFFRVRPSDLDDNAFIDDKELKEYILDKIRELLKK